MTCSTVQVLPKWHYVYTFYEQNILTPATCLPNYQLYVIILIIMLSTPHIRKLVHITPQLFWYTWPVRSCMMNIEIISECIHMKRISLILCQEQLATCPSLITLLWRFLQIWNITLSPFTLAKQSLIATVRYAHLSQELPYLMWHVPRCKCFQNDIVLTISMIKTSKPLPNYVLITNKMWSF